MQVPDIRNVALMARPCRTACIVPAEADASLLADQLLRAGRRWGGWSTLFLPTDGKTLHPYFLGMLRAFDPDVVTNPTSITLGAELDRQLRLLANPFQFLNEDGVIAELGLTDLLWTPVRLGDALDDYAPALWPSAGWSGGPPGPRELMGLSICGGAPRDEGGVSAVGWQSWGRCELPRSLHWTARPISPHGAFAQGLLTATVYLKPRRRVQAIVVYGRATADFCLFHGLLRSRYLTAWLPTWEGALDHASSATLEVPEEVWPVWQAAIRALAPELRDGSATLTCLSISLSEDELRAWLGAFAEHAAPEGIDTGALRGATTGEVDPADLVRDWPMVLETQGPEVPENTPRAFRDSVLVGHLFPRVPRLFRQETERLEVGNWVTRVGIEGQPWPARRCLNRLLSGDPLDTGGRVRAGRGTLDMTGRRVLALGGPDLAVNLTQTQPRLVSPMDVARVMFRGIGYDVRLSAAGAFSEHAQTLLGGLEQAASLLRNPVVLHVLERLRASEVDERGRRDSSREGTIADIEGWVTEAAGDEHAPIDPRGLMDLLLGMGAVRRGVFVKCGYCRNGEWCPVEEMGARAPCRRCGRNAAYPVDAPWKYVLDPALEQCVGHNGHVPILLAARLCAEADYPWTSACVPAAELWKDPACDEPWMEIDVCAFIDGRIVLGEATTEDCYGDVTRCTRLKDLCRELIPDEVVFATAADKWSPAAEASFDRLRGQLRALPISVRQETASYLFLRLER